MKTPKLCTFLTFCLLASDTAAETVKDREGSVRDDRAKMEKNSRWIYNDVDAGFAAARESGKPLMVVLRCVPCLACMGIDAEVLIETEELTPLMDKFVRVRVINANALNLSLFQFDYDLSFSTMFFNGDGTVYGRYGSWNHQHDAQNKATAGFRRSLEGALKLHENFPTNKSALAGKRGEPSQYKTPIDMPTLQGKYREDLNWDGKVVQSCVHCHQIGDAQRLSFRDKNRPLPLKWIYSFPAPESIGINLSDEAIAKIESVTTGSIAADAGLKSGDEIVALEGQPLISTADISWILHNSPDSGTLTALVDRDGRRAAITIPLPDGWRARSDISGRVGTWPMRAMAFGGMRLEELSEEEKAKHKLAPGQMALFAKNVGQYGKHGAAKKQGFQKGDIIIAIDGDDESLTESELIGRLILEYKPGRKVPATVLRGGKKIDLKIPVQ